MAEDKDTLFATEGEEAIEVVDDLDDNAYTEVHTYREEDEPFPKEPAYHKDFPVIEKKIIAVIEGLLAVIPAELRQAAIFKHLVESTEHHLKGLPTTPKWRINVVGASGSGKSSLLNCVLGRPDLAKSGAASKGCTHVPTTYESGFKGQRKPYAATIEFFTTDEIRTKLTLMLKDYYAWTQNQEDLSTELKAEVEAASSTAFDAFRSLFREKPEFSTKEASKRYLQSLYQLDHAAVVDQLMSWCNDLIARESHQATYKEFDDQDELVRFTKPFAFSTATSRNAALWPLVKYIRQGLLGIRILDYIVLTDWPGADDTNKIRAKASAERIYDCDEMWLVARAQRISSEPVLKTNLVRYSDDVPCTVICTCVEDSLDDNLVVDLEEAGKDMAEYKHLARVETELKQKIKTCKDMLTDREQAEASNFVKRGTKRYKLTDEQRARWVEEAPRLRQELRSLKADIRTVGEKRIKFLVEARKQYISGLIREEVFQQLEGGKFNLFCVSNKDYNRHKTGDSDGHTCLSVDCTGIPQLRRYILEEAAHRTLKNVKDFIETDISVLLHGAIAVTNRDGLEGSKRPLEIIKTKGKELAAIIDGHLASVNSLTNNRLTLPLIENQARFGQTAKKHLQQKSRLHPSAFRAFVNHEGCHSTKSVPDKESWNEDFMEDLIHFLIGDLNNGSWQVFQKDEKDVLGQLQNRLVDKCEEIATELQGDAAQLPGELRGFLDAQAQRIRPICDRSGVTFARSLNRVKYQATEVDDACPDSYFKSAMKPVYEKCMDEKGEGCTSRMKQILERHLAATDDDSPFAVHNDTMSSDIAVRATQNFATLLAEVKHVFDDIHSWLEPILLKKSRDWGVAWFNAGAASQREEATVAKLKNYAVEAKAKVDYIKALIADVEDKCKAEE